MALAPDNIRPHPPEVVAGHGVLAAVVNPVPGVVTRRDGILLGHLFGPGEAWWRLGTDSPDGTYAIARFEERSLELLTDVLATRQLWYVHTSDLFAASTSQRALVMLLGSFDLDRETVAWMLSAGHLCGRSWDTRIRRLRGDCRLVLDRGRWTVAIHERPAVRDPLPADDAAHVDLLRQAILDTCASLDLPREEWLLPLSGGMDSRVLLLGLLEAGAAPRCVTWGERSSLLDPQNDAFIARQLARTYGLDHTYRPTDENHESMAVALRRFVTVSQGQVRDFGGYADGMAMWRAFFEEGIAGVIRGDEPGIGYWEHYDSESQILRRRRLDPVADYPAGHPIHRLGLVPQSGNERAARLPGESLTAWDVRTYEEVFYPAILAPLNAVKAAYVEIVNPLQSRRVIEVTRRLPDHLRIRRRPLAAVVAALGPDVPLATKGALAGTPALWKDAPAAAAIRDALAADGAERVLSRAALDLILAGATAPPPKSPAGRTLSRKLKAVVPRKAAIRLHPASPPRLSGRELAFRAYIAVQTTDIISRDAALLGEQRGASPDPGR
jgi:hypothetical protein